MELNGYIWLQIIVVVGSVILICLAVYKIYNSFTNYTIETNKQFPDKEIIKVLRDKKNRSVLLWAPICIICLWVLSWMLIDLCYQQSTGDKVGTFGDKFGAINALFSGLAFSGLIMTLVLQKEELEAQREELRQTHEELKNQRHEFEAQNKTLRQQQIATTFFQLLNAVQKNIDYLEKNYGYTGMTYFAKVLDAIKYSIRTSKTYTKTQNISQEEAKKIYENLYRQTYFPMGIFFRSYYRLIKYVVTSGLDDYEKYQYISFARAQLSDEVLSVLFYNLTIGYGVEKFKPMAEDWVLLKNISPKTFVIKEMRDWISDDAFYRKGRYEEDEEKKKMHIE